MKQTFGIILIITLLASSNMLAQMGNQNNISESDKRNSEFVKFVAADFTSCLGTASSDLYTRRYVISRNLKDGSSELSKLIYFSQCRPSLSESLFEVKPSYYQNGVKVILRKPNDKEIKHCDSFLNFVDIDTNKINKKRNNQTLRFVSLEYNASMLFEFQQMECFVWESVVTNEKD